VTTDADADQEHDPDDPGVPSTRVPGPVRAATGRLQRRYEGSAVRELAHRLGAVEFGDRIVLFGAALLLSVLPMIILLSAFASQRIDDDIAVHLGLNRQGSHVMESLFRPSSITVNLAVLVSLLLSLAGTLAMARSVQVAYERAFDQPPRTGVVNLGRCLVWVLCVGALLIADGAVGRTMRNEPGGPWLLGLVDFAALALFFWWSIHFLLAGRTGWRPIVPAAVATSAFWIGLGVFASTYFSSTIVSDSRLYGTIGVVFTLVTWFIAMGAVIVLGAVFGATWNARRTRKGRRSATRR